MRTKLLFLLLALAISIALWAFGFYCAKKIIKSQKQQYITHTDTIKGDTVFRQYPVSSIQYRSVDTNNTKWRTQPIDTAAILQQFHATYFYRDTIKDSSFNAIIAETISQNRVVKRSFYLQNLRPTAIVTTVTTKQYKWYGGAALTYGNRIGIGIQAGGQFKYGLITATADPINRTASLGILLPFK